MLYSCMLTPIYIYVLYIYTHSPLHCRGTDDTYNIYLVCIFVFLGVYSCWCRPRLRVSFVTRLVQCKCLS